MSDRKSYGMVILGAALWGTIGIFIKFLSALGLDSLQLMVVRTLFAMVCLGIFIGVSQPQALKIHWRDLHYFLGTGIISLSIFNYCYFNAIALSSISVAVTLLYTAPIFVMIMSAFLFDEKMTTSKLVALGMTLVGCTLVTEVFQQGGAVSLRAILFGIGSGFAYALYSIFSKYALRKYGTFTISFYTFLIASIGVLFVIDISQLVAVLSVPDVFLGSVGIAVFCTVLPYLLYTQGLMGIEPGKASILATVEPLVAAGIGIFMYSESAELPKLMGMGLIFSSVFLIHKK